MSTDATAPSDATAAVNPPSDAPSVDKGKGKGKAVAEHVETEEEDDDEEEEDEDDEMDEDDEDDDEDDDNVEKVDPTAILPPGSRRKRAAVDYTSAEAQEKAGVANVPEEEDHDDQFVGDKSMEH